MNILFNSTHDYLYTCLGICIGLLIGHFIGWFKCYNAYKTIIEKQDKTSEDKND